MAITRVFLAMILVTQLMVITRAAVGVNYGTKGDNLPSFEDGIYLIKSKNISMVRFFEPHHEALDALRGSGIKVALGTLNEDITKFATDVHAAYEWAAANIDPYRDDSLIRYVVIGDEAIQHGGNSLYVPDAIKNLQNAIYALALTGEVLITTTVPMSVLNTSFPPSEAVFRDDLVVTMGHTISILQEANTPIMLNVYPYFAYAANPKDISLDYALFKANKPVFVDKGFEYYTLYDAMLDAFLAAAVKVGASEDFSIIVSESGWPSAGNKPYMNINNAQAYNNLLKQHVLTKGTPRRPNLLLDVFIFSLFNENQKGGAIEEGNFGNFYPNMTDVYPLW